MSVMNASMTICNNMINMDQYGLITHARSMILFKSLLKVFLVPVGTPYANLWHALHWWVPALALKEE